jgi:hypothetical protein
MSRELDSTNYHLLLMIERMQREGRSEAAIRRAVRSAASCKPSTKLARIKAVVRPKTGLPA